MFKIPFRTMAGQLYSRNKIHPKTLKHSQAFQAIIQEKLRICHEKSIYSSFRIFMRYSQVLGILPLENLSDNVEKLQFKWRSWKVIYSMFLMVLLGIAVVSFVVHWVVSGSSINGLDAGVFYGGSLLTLILYLRLAISWPKLMQFWYSMDKIMNVNYGYPRKLDFTVRAFMVIFAVLGFADYLLSIGSKYEEVLNRHKSNISAEDLVAKSAQELFKYIPYSIATAPFFVIITVHSHLTWALNDMFIVVASTALAIRFRQITQKLGQQDKQKIVSLVFWKGIREDYDRLASFCKELDSHISPIILLSYFLNIFFLLIQLYHGLESISLTVSKVYFVFSFVYLIFKTTTVSLYAAWINDESKGPTNALNSIDSSIYNVEVR
ncbi:gustatory receptor for sugar taste 64f-like [Euwallacea fornicatus]|uniref:gustatory receptor for sugar taste 64f-like n=1 Tax=Euwallacea fornicatus TaxID=995702 RepID=UPI00338FF102